MWFARSAGRLLLPFRRDRADRVVIGISVSCSITNMMIYYRLASHTSWFSTLMKEKDFFWPLIFHLFFSRRPTLVAAIKAYAWPTSTKDSVSAWCFSLGWSRLNMAAYREYMQKFYLVLLIVFCGRTYHVSSQRSPAKPALTARSYNSFSTNNEVRNPGPTNDYQSSAVSIPLVRNGNSENMNFRK